MAAAAFTWVVLGLLVASAAKLVAWDETPLGWGPVLLAGVAGGAFGGYVSGFLWPATDVPTGFNPAALLLAIAGAAVLVWVYYLAIGRAKLAKGDFAVTHRRAA